MLALAARVSVCALLLPSIAAAQCPSQADVRNGNQAADAVFRQRAVDAASLRPAAASLPQGFVEVEAFGARGDGVADDSAALQKALENGKRVWLAPQRTYRISRRIDLRTNNELASNGTATLLMSAGPNGFSNAVARRTDNAIYGERGTGFRLEGERIAIRDLFIVKEFEEDRYVIGIDVRAANQARIQRVRMRGFSLAPGIITIRSSTQVEVSSTLIHDACTASSQVPQDVTTFQVTGISVDDSRVEGRPSSNVVLEKNVIANLQMIPRTSRQSQTDGINFAGSGGGSGFVIRNNHISGVEEALDLFSSDIQVSGNVLEGGTTVIKLIHGANSIRIHRNTIAARGRALAIGMFRANPPEQRRQVRDITIEENRFQVTQSARYTIEVDNRGEFLPRNISIRNNSFEVSQCTQPTVACSREQCSFSSNVLRKQPDKTACPQQPDGSRR